MITMKIDKIEKLVLYFLDEWIGSLVYEIWWELLLFGVFSVAIGSESIIKINWIHRGLFWENNHSEIGSLKRSKLKFSTQFLKIIILKNILNFCLLNWGSLKNSYWTELLHSKKKILNAFFGGKLFSSCQF